MAVLVLRQRGPAQLSEAVVDEVQQHPDLHILDRSSKMLRVEGACHDLQAVADRHPGLMVCEEQSYEAVEPLQKKADKPPSQGT